MEEYWAPTVVHINRAIYGRLHARLVYFVDSRLEAMDRAGIERSVLSLTCPAYNGNPMRRWRAAGLAKPTMCWPARSGNDPAATQDSRIWRCRTRPLRALNSPGASAQQFLGTAQGVQEEWGACAQGVICCHRQQSRTLNSICAIVHR
jgi:hypothetical protein